MMLTIPTRAPLWSSNCVGSLATVSELASSRQAANTTLCMHPPHFLVDGKVYCFALKKGTGTVVQCSTFLHAGRYAQTMSRLTKYMPAVVGYRERLATLQGAWDSLALLSHLSDDGTNLSNTREAFESLAADLVTHLETETHKKALLAARARAQVAIDILVRNLFERTGDIGFLAADDDIRQFAAGVDANPRSMQQRLAEYVSKYSVYAN